MRPPEYLLQEDDNIVDLTQYPDKSMRRQLLGGETFDLPDLHASAEKMLVQLMLDGILDISKEAFDTLISIFISPNPLTKDEFETIKNILYRPGIFEIDKLGLQHYLGDMVCDRRKNCLLILTILTAFTSAIIAWIKLKNPTYSDEDAYNEIWNTNIVKLEANIGNHDAELLRNYADGTLHKPQTGIGLVASASMQALAKSINDGVVTVDEVNKMIAKSYLPHLRIYTFSIDSLYIISGFAHALTDLLDLRNLYLLSNRDDAFALVDPGDLKESHAHVSFALAAEKWFSKRIRSSKFAGLIPTVEQVRDKKSIPVVKNEQNNKVLVNGKVVVRGKIEVELDKVPRECVLLRWIWNRIGCESFSKLINYTFMMNHGHNGDCIVGTDQTKNLDNDNLLGKFIHYMKGPLIRRVSYFSIEPPVFLRIVKIAPALFTANYSNRTDDINYRTNLSAALYCAAENGDIEVMKVLILQAGIDIDARNDTSKLTALEVAQQKGHVKVVQLFSSIAAKLARIRFKPTSDIEQQEADVLIDSFPWKGDEAVVYLFSPACLSYALAKAAQINRWDVVERLLQLRVQLRLKPTSAIKQNGYSTHDANNQQDLIARLFAAREDVNSQHSRDCPTPLIIAAESRDVTLTTFTNLLTLPNIEINNRCQGETALFVAAERGDLQKVTALLAMEGIDVDATNIATGQTALQVVQQSGHHEVEALLTSWPAKLAKLKFSLSLKNNEVTCALLYELWPWQDKAAVINLLPNDVIVDLLPYILEKAIDEDIDLLIYLLLKTPNGINQLINGATLLHHVIERFKLDILIKLLEFDADIMTDITISIYNKGTPIQYAADLAINDQTEASNKQTAWRMVIFIAQHDQKSFHTSDRANCAHALVTAASVGEWDVVVKLIELKVSLTGFFVFTGYSAFHFAVCANQHNVIRAIHAAGGNINFQAASNQPTPLILAAGTRSVTIETFKLLLSFREIDISHKMNNSTAFSAASAVNDFDKIGALLAPDKQVENRLNGYHAQPLVVTNSNAPLENDRIAKYREYLLSLLNNCILDIEKLMKMRDLHRVLSIEAIVQIVLDLISQRYKEDNIITQIRNISLIKQYLEVREEKIRLKNDFFSDSARLQENMDFFNQFFNLENDQRPVINGSVSEDITNKNIPAREDLRKFLFAEYREFLNGLQHHDAVKLASVKLTYLYWAKKQAVFVQHTSKGFFATFGKTKADTELDKMISAQISILDSQRAPQPQSHQQLQP